MDGITLLWFCLTIAEKFVIFREPYYYLFYFFILILDCCEALWDFFWYI